MKVLWLADSGSPHIERWLKALSSHPIEIEVQSMPKRRPRFFYIADLFSMWLKIKRESPDIVHAHFASSYGVILSLLPISSRKIISVWGSDVLLTPYKNRLYYYLVKRALLLPNVRIANSEYLATEAAKIADRTYQVLPFGIELAYFPFQTRSFNPRTGETFVIGIAKRLHRVVGLDILLRAFSLLIKQHQDISFKLVVIGSGPEEDALKSLAIELGVQANVSWTGWRSPESVGALFQDMHLTVMPSRVEGLGVAAIEAMASGLPVLGSNQGGLLELIGEREERGTLAALNQQSLAEKIYHCASNYEATLKKANNARQYVEKKFDISENAKQLMHIYHSLY